MEHITCIKDSACVRGTFTSILTDCKSPNEETEGVLEEINQRTTGNNTEIHPTEVAKLIENCFEECAMTEIRTESDFDELEAVDNSTSFGVLFWRGDGKGNNHHSTRFVGQNDNKIMLMDPQRGIITELGVDELFSLAPQGFDFVKMWNK